MKRLLGHLTGALLWGTVVTLVIALVYYIAGNYEGEFTYIRVWRIYYENMIFAVILYLVNAYWLQHLLIRYKNNLFTFKRFMIAISGNVIVSIVGVFMAKLILNVGINKVPFATFLSSQSAEGYTISIAISLLVALIFYAIWLSLIHI